MSWIKLCETEKSWQNTTQRTCRRPTLQAGNPIWKTQVLPRRKKKAFEIVEKPANFVCRKNTYQTILQQLISTHI